ncbi:MAG TPA: hypothetical protein VGR37_24055 [Longimicrobiaceae bacterium]|nr:hypothetical protein [Longimicrobiaceae bacterium]
MIGRRIALVLACLAGAALTACGDAGTLAPRDPEPGTLTVMLTTPAADDRAVLISVSGPDEAGAVTDAGGGYSVYARPGGTALRVAVFGKISSGKLVTLSVPDVNRASAYRATIQEVVDPSSNVRPSLAGYSAAITR